MAYATPFEVLPETVRVRIAGRLGMTFFLNHLRIACDGRDLLNGLILLAIGHANYSRLDRREYEGRYAGLDTLPPPDLCQPISIKAVADSFGMPFETVRRRVAGLRAEHACELGDHGLTIPPGSLNGPRSRLRALAVWTQLRTLYLGLRDLGLAPSPLTRPSEPPPIMAAERCAAEYVLRQLEAMTAHIDDPTIGVLLIHIIRATTDHLDDTYTEYTQVEDLVSDRLRRPAPVSLLSSRAGLPPETTRRHAAFLLDRGWVARAPEGGLYLTREMLRAPPWPDARRQNVANLTRLLAGLEASGALAHWAPTDEAS